MTLPDHDATMRELQAIVDDPDETLDRRDAATWILEMAARAAEVADVVAEVRAMADDPAVDEPRRRALRAMLEMVEQACDVAQRWGGDDNAAMRAVAIRTAEGREPHPYDFGEQRYRIALALDRLCHAFGVPLEETLAPGA